MDHNAGPRAACVTMLITLLVFLLSAIAIIFRLDDDRTAGALRAALTCLIFIYLAYLLFEVKVLQLLFSLFHFHPATYYDPQPPLSFVGSFSPLGSSVGREPSPEETAGGGRASPPAPSSEAGYMASDSKYMMPEAPAPYFFSGGDGGCYHYHRRRAPSTGTHRSSSSRRSSSSVVSSSSEATTDLLTSEDEVESWMGGSWAASRSPSRGRRRSRHGGGTVAHTKLKHTKR
ncbi:unnamed protein product [Urochloa humidicola]